MVMMAHVPQTSLNIDPCRPSHQHQRDEAREREARLEFFRAPPLLRLGGAFGEAGGFLR